MSDNDRLDLAGEEENIARLGDVYRAGPDFVRRLIAAVRERDAEIARLKAGAFNCAECGMRVAQIETEP